MGSFSPWHWAILAVVVVLLFGAKKLPDAARSLGKSLRIFRSEVREMQNESKSDPAVGAAPHAPPTHVQSERVDPPTPAGRSEATRGVDPEHSHTDARPA